MNQLASFPLSEQKTSSNVEEEKKALPKSGPSQVILEIIDPNKKKLNAFVNGRVTTWRALPPRRKRFIALFSFSVLLSVVMSLVVTGIARRVARRRVIKATI